MSEVTGEVRDKEMKRKSYSWTEMSATNLLTKLAQPTPNKKKLPPLLTTPSDSEEEDYGNDLEGDFKFLSKPPVMSMIPNVNLGGGAKKGMVTITPESMGAFMSAGATPSKNATAPNGPKAGLTSHPGRLPSDPLPKPTAASSSNAPFSTKKAHSRKQSQEDEDKRKDKDAVNHAIGLLKSFQEDSNKWFRKLEYLRLPVQLGSVHQALIEASEKQDQVKDLARETSWLEQEVDRVEDETSELDLQIKTLQASIADVRALIEYATEPPPETRSVLRTLIVWLLVLLLAWFVLVVSKDVFGGYSNRNHLYYRRS